MGKTNPLNDGDLKEFVELQKTFAESDNSWVVRASAGSATGDAKTVPSVPSAPELAEGGEGADGVKWGKAYDLSVKNPNTPEEVPLRAPEEIIEEIIALDKESEVILGRIQELL